MTPTTSLRRPRRILTLLIALVVPLLVAAAFTTTLAHPGRHAEEVVAAVVNNDEPVELEGQTVPLGRQLAAALAEGKGLGEGEVENYEWVMTNEDLAREGLDSGEYGAVVTIPPEFSAAATSTAEEDADPRQALIEVTTSPRARLVDDAVTHTIVRAAMGSVGNDLTGSYLENIFVGFNTLGEELGDAAEGAQSLAQGARDLAGGAGELAGGSEQLSDGVEELAAGTGELAGGASELADGTHELVGGTGELSAGASELAGGLNELASGSRELSGGTSELASGVSGLRAGTKELSTGASALSAGASELEGGSQELAGGVEELTAGLGELSGGAQELAGGLDELNNAVDVVPEHLDQIEEGIVAGASEVRDFADRLGGASGTVQEIIDAVCAADPEGEACAALQEHVGNSEDLQQFLQDASEQLHALADSMEDFTGDEGGLGEIQQLFTGINELARGADELAAGLEQAHDASGELGGGARDLAQGNAELAEGLAGLSSGASELDSGVGELQSGAVELDRGTTQIASASGAAAGGADELAGGASELASGTRGLAQGADELAAGTNELSAGAGALVDGADELSSGTEELAGGADELAGGTGELADGLDEATQEIPHYPDGERETLADVLADPVALSDPGGVGFTWLASFAMVALWAGGLWLLGVYPAVAAGARTSTRSATALTFRSMKVPALIAAAQGFGVTIIAAVFTDLAASVGLGLGMLAALASVVFMAVQRGLVAAFGRVGIVLTVLIAAFAVATALTSAMPAFAPAVVSWLPIGPAISATQGLEASISGIAGPILGLLAWGAAGVIAVIFATRRAQSR